MILDFSLVLHVSHQITLLLHL